MITIKRSLIALNEHQVPLTWLPLKTADGPSASFVCPNGHDGILTDHQIAGDGIVAPSVICPNCAFHDYIRLEGWSGG